MNYQEIWQICALISGIIGSACCGYAMNRGSYEHKLKNKTYDMGDAFIGSIIMVVISMVLGPLGIAYWIGDTIFEFKKDKTI